MADTDYLKPPVKDPPDLHDRDFYMLNEHLVVDFEDIIAEPDGIHTFPCLWNAAFNCFNFCNSLCYTLNTLCCSFCAVVYGSGGVALSFFCHIWCGTPALKCVSYWLLLPRRLVQDCLECLVIPCCEDMGQYLHGHLSGHS